MSVLDYKELTAAQLADALDGFAQHGTNIGTASMLTEAALGFVIMKPDVGLGGLVNALDTARMPLFRDTSEQAWSTARQAAAALAQGLRELGDYRVPRCDICGWVLRNGRCGNMHIGADELICGGDEEARNGLMP